MITINKDFDYYINLPLTKLRSANFITMIDVDDDMRLGLYYLMNVYHLGFHHMVRADWEWICLSRDKEGEYLNATDILSLERDEEVYTKLKDEFNRGLRPNGYKGKKQDSKEYEEPVFQFTGKFGWLSPIGEFTISDWGEHEGSAYDIIEDKRFMDEYDDWEGDGILRLARDFLSIVKGYVLIHNPSADGGYMVTHTKPITKKQREFLYQYFYDMGNRGRAEMYLNEEE